MGKVKRKLTLCVRDIKSLGKWDIHTGCNQGRANFICGIQLKSGASFGGSILSPRELKHHVDPRDRKIKNVDKSQGGLQVAPKLCVHGESDPDPRSAGAGCGRWWSGAAADLASLEGCSHLAAPGVAAADPGESSKCRQCQRSSGLPDRTRTCKKIRCIYAHIYPL